MNKWGKGVLAALFTFSLAGCAGGGSTDAKLPDAEELMDRIAEAGSGLNSYVQESRSKITTGTSPDTGAADFTSETATTSEYILSPLQLHQSGSTIVEDKEPMDAESYLTDSGFYMYYNGFWRKMPDTMLEDLKFAAEVQSSPVRRMEQLKTILPYVTVSEEKDEYVLSAQLSGEETKDLESFYKLQYSNDNLAGEQLALVKSMSLEYRVNKQTYWPTGTVEELVTEESLEGEGTYREVKQTTSIGLYNTVKEIVIPEEALNAAE
ncbi:MULTISPECIES: DUF6612 family protein [unclassified Paenibacillus]|uniref:DUF6612 family protein n=1 Tax=unclassified Paenibacillus TaxID=185978 RepID=UPI002407628E|nr:MULTISPECIES: DUF6612 family protein [unclassified Paenibacillus]MDF9842505.1 hypothetical protein [Paenibacillus sp. PastF-2]MDF9849095.1 hypothetical protein [Paenibacillus sp. PastM-2]MDF9855665.1 hypothetical protein [Paenibacillus sp. PastF-1]MDH6480937.1 hypothetical protein [Paenibacillus sp. PastH-2]MDH6508359.1 hypothetical protein [Paenibacillus sp. PastM-3]